MAKSKALINAELRIAALESQLTLARSCYRTLKASVSFVESRVAAEKQSTMPVVTRYNDCLGRTWIKTRIGNQSSSRLAT